MAWTSPRTWVAGEKPTAATMNTHIRDNFKAIGDPWTAYTPTWTNTSTNPTIGNGTLTGSYMAAGKWIQFRILLTVGSTTTFGTGTLYAWSLPVTPLTLTARVPVGTAVIFDASVPAVFTRNASIEIGSSTVIVRAEAGTAVTSTVPMTWATSDQLAITGAYEAA